MRRIIASIAVALAMALGMGATASAATSCTEKVGMMLPGGPGHSSSVYAGTWKCGELVGFCVNFGLHGPDQNVGPHVIGQIPGTTQAESDVAAMIDGTYRLTTNKLVAAQAAYAIWKIIGDKDFRTYNAWAVRTNQFPDVRKGASRMIAEAKQLLGLRLKVKLVTGEIGKFVPGVVKASSHGKPLAGVKVSLTAQNGTLSRSGGVTNEAGELKFKVYGTTLGVKTTVHAKTSVVKVGYIVSTSPTVGQQTIVSVPKKVQKQAMASYLATVKGPKIVSECDTNCDGTADMTVNACAANVKLHYVGSVDGAVAYEMTVAAKTCKTKRFQLVDQDVLSHKVCSWAGGACTSDYVRLPGKFVVNCPPAPPVFMQVGCDCEDVKDFTLVIDMTNITRTGYTERHKVNDGNFSAAAKLANGQKVEVVFNNVNQGDTVTMVIAVEDASWTFTAKVPTYTAKAAKSLRVPIKTFVYGDAA